MPTLKNLFFPSKSSRNSPKKQESSSSRRLTRQRKLRHVSDGWLGLSPTKRSPADSPKPQPLPLPEIRRSLRGRGSERAFSQRSKEGTSKGNGDGRDDRVDVKPSSLDLDRSALSLQFVDKTPNYPTTKSEKPTTYFRRGFPLSPGDENGTHNFRLNVPARSAPTSPLSSPRPQRFNRVDSVPLNPQFLFSTIPKENVLSNCDRGSPSLLFPNGHLNTPDHSPHHAPKQKHGFQNTNYHNFHTQNVPARSAPTSPLSRPLHNPQRFNSVNVVPSNPQFLFSSFPKENVLSNSDRGSPSLLFPNGHLNTPDRSPLHSPKQKHGFQNTNHHNFHPLNVPPRSAPTSPLSRPLRNPQRFNSVNFVPSNSQFLFSSFRKENVLSNSDRGSPSLLFPNGHLKTPDHSPHHSPMQKHGFQNTNHHNLHPLPLPPSSPKQTKSPTMTRTTEKPEASSTKSQWVKGKLIGRGTYGSVFEAVNSETGAMCAMKEVDILLDDTKSVECIKQLEQEIKILQHLEHKNIVRYYGCEVVGDHFCIYLEYVHPGSINKYVRDHFGAITESVVRNFTRHILSGLAYLHSTDTVHRDIKGANLLVDSSGIVKLADFGLAKHLTVAAADLSLKGSPHWMAPELLQAVMRKDSDHHLAYAIDIWSLGCTVIEMFNGKPPWSEFNGVQALFHVMHKSPDIPESLSWEGKDFLRWCFKRNPSERPTAAQLLNHPFVRTTKERGFSTCTLDFSGIKLSDSSCSPREQPNVHRSLPSSPLTRRPLARVGGRFTRESSREATRGSPCSTLEAFSSISSPDFRSNLPNINSYTSSPKNLRFAIGYDYLDINRKARKGFSRSFEDL